MTETVTESLNANFKELARSDNHTDVTIQNRGGEAAEIVIAAALASAGDVGYLIQPGDERQFSGYTGVISGRAPFGHHATQLVLVRS